MTALQLILMVFAIIANIVEILMAVDYYEVQKEYDFKLTPIFWAVVYICVALQALFIGSLIV